MPSAFQLLIVLALIALGFSSTSAMADEKSNPVWPVSASDPGPSMPKVGRSLFDHLMFEPGRGFEIPFPISALFKKIETKTGILPDLTGKSSIKTALIPVGRSLQRYAADPNFFKYPRAIFAFTKAPANTAKSVFNVRDRLYIAYQEKAEALEVISYNEQAGRFEFQIISDYASGRKPILEYAERSVCISCHQNHAPIFATAPWDESGTNRIVAKRMAVGGKNRYAVPVKSSFDVTDQLDQSTDRANRIPIFQKIWSDSCVFEEGIEFEVKCRAALLLSSLKYGLSGYAKSERGSDPAEQAFRQNLVTAFDRKWPEGLAESSPDLPNRILDAFLKMADFKFRNLLEPEGKHNPQTVRDRKKIWFTDNADAPLSDQVLLGFSHFLTLNDLHIIDQALRKRRKEAGISKFAGRCFYANGQANAGAQKLIVQCSLKDGKEVSLELTILLHRQDGIIMGGEVLNGVLAKKTSFFKLQLENKTPSVAAGTDAKYSFSLRQKGTGLTVRLRAGDSLDDLKIEFSGEIKKQAMQKISISVTRYITSEILDTAFKSLIQNALRTDHVSEGNPLTQKVFQRSLVMNAVLSVLGESEQPTCCYQTASMPSPVVEGN